MIDQGRYDDACKVLMVALAETPDHPDVHLLLAFCMSEKDDHAKAIEHAESAIARQPEYAYAHYAYASVLLGAGKQRQALAPAMESVRLETDNPTNHGIVAVVHMMLRQINQKRPLFVNAERRLPERPGNRFALTRADR